MNNVKNNRPSRISTVSQLMYIWLQADLKMACDGRKRQNLYEYGKVNKQNI